jgi:hypothetical protein
VYHDATWLLLLLLGRSLQVTPTDRMAMLSLVS